MSKDQEQLLSLDLIDRPIKIARETIDPEKVRELAESIREHGQLQAIEVRPANGRYEIVYGDRRYLAHKLLGLKKIRAMVRDRDDRETVIIRGIENLQRENLTASEEANVYLSLKEDGGLTPIEIARKTGKHPDTIKRYLAFGLLPVDIRKSVDQKVLSMGTLLILSEIQDPEAFKYYFDQAFANGITEKVARLWVDDYGKTLAGKFYEQSSLLPGVEVDSTPKPAFVTCDTCHAPVEVKDIRHLIICKECSKKVRVK